MFCVWSFLSGNLKMWNKSPDSILSLFSSLTHTLSHVLSLSYSLILLFLCLFMSKGVFSIKGSRFQVMSEENRDWGCVTQVDKMLTIGFLTAVCWTVKATWSMPNAIDSDISTVCWLRKFSYLRSCEQPESEWMTFKSLWQMELGCGSFKKEMA